MTLRWPLRLSQIGSDDCFPLCPLTIHGFARPVHERLEVARVLRSKVSERVPSSKKLSVPHSEVRLFRLQNLSQPRAHCGRLFDKVHEGSGVEGLSKLLGR